MTGSDATRKGKPYRSMLEFQKEFLPKAAQQKTTQYPVDARALGASLAKESLDRVRQDL
jgi:hypothetical protein